MSGTLFPDPTQGHQVAVACFGSLDRLPSGTDALFAANPGLFNSPGWWRNVLAFGLHQGDQALFLLCRLGSTPVALLPLRRHAGGKLSALTTPYTCLYQPLLASGLNAVEQRSVFAAFTRFCRRVAYMRFDALAAENPALAVWEDAARSEGLVVVRFDCFGNWFERVAGPDWHAYLASRHGALRETIRRRLRRAERDSISFEVVRSPQGVEAGIVAYEQVYARSWKEPEPFPHFNAGLIQLGAGAGWLRLGILRNEKRPIAVQLWSVEQGVASVHKLAHDEAFKPLSPGTVLTACMLRHLLDEEHVAEIDFGRGDDEYKRGWAGQRRQRIGIILANPLRPAGAAVWLRHMAGQTHKVIRTAVLSHTRR